MDSFSGRSNRSIPAREPHASRAAEAPRPVDVAPAREPVTHHRPEKNRPKKWLWAVGGIVLLALIACGAWKAWTMYNVPGVAGDKYQAVFLTNGQVYFGKLGVQSPGFYKLSNVFYLQASQQTTADAKNPQQTSGSSNSDVQLIKLGNEIHGPEDSMVIARDQVLFFENLKQDGKVSATIKDYNDKNKK